MEMGPFLTQDPAIWWRQIEVNLSGHFRLVQAVVPLMRARGGGRIVLISSGWGVIGHPNATAYAASKAGLIALAKGLGRELAPKSSCQRRRAVDLGDSASTTPTPDLTRRMRGDTEARDRQLAAQVFTAAGAFWPARRHGTVGGRACGGAPGLSLSLGRETAHVPTHNEEKRCPSRAKHRWDQSTAAWCRASPGPRPSPGCPRSTG
jgi:NAD(P)-dependent dehydrogenase (short-subunit alcohol dehydrogenase family)